mmetsp:Transcript_19296/g.27147  ORF Transcript_19296/g.27147 Transcript_19296/m.27147 type:complete len:383 (+) Transcript_19296:114-1262(+)|eukprot:CAMPEP_0184865634 /NCGR_PEP_ID=MMETSP0580-20130426/18707_1 /TAXON_ID=1118495 /ORGANISM="Dactyliosolen fragilissimus" /LENGTH=382 /DNA_ID=CAMNT_0027364917 /DNA_START=40 /DNA_END=1188 /DNA_ORIENTATION=+
MDKTIYAVPVVPIPTEESEQCYSTIIPPKPITEDQTKYLMKLGFTRGLATSLTTNFATFPWRIWIVDNSGSMNSADGHRIVSSMNDKSLKFVSCTRWAEIKETVEYHVNISGLLEAPTTFRLLNNPGGSLSSKKFGSVFDIALTKGNTASQVSNAMKIMSNTRPTGTTPLTSHVMEVHNKVKALKNQLVADGKRVSIIIATDGLPTDTNGLSSEYAKQEFVNSLRLLEELPVWVVIRLCTDEESVVDFYNSLDEQLELSMDVLDDFEGEAKEIYEHNKWLNYTLPLHRLREMGFHDRVFDLLDERTLTSEELRIFCSILFGMEKFDGVADPAVDWASFLKDIKNLLSDEESLYNPIKKSITPLLDLKKMNQIYGDGSSCAIM